MTGKTQSIIFENERKPIHHIEPGMVEAVLNMIYMPELVLFGDYLYIEYPEDKNGEGEVHIQKEHEHVVVAKVINDPDSIETIKEVKTLGNSVAVAISMECRMLGIVPGDKIRIRIEKIDEEKVKA